MVTNKLKVYFGIGKYFSIDGESSICIWTKDGSSITSFPWTVLYSKYINRGQIYNQLIEIHPRIVIINENLDTIQIPNEKVPQVVDFYIKLLRKIPNVFYSSAVTKKMSQKWTFKAIAPTTDE